MLAGRAQWAATGQRVGEAEPLYRELLGSYPNEPGVHYAHGLFLMESDKSAALDEFQHELRSNPRHWPSLLASAFLQTSSGDPRAAISSIQRAAKYAPEGYRWLCNAELGRAYLALNETAAAIPLFELAAKQEPQSAQTHFYLEQAFRRSGRKAEAAREHAEFVRIKAEQDPLSTPSEVAK
jgi:tetratricopeptide (TPR) repeat protein